MDTSLKSLREKLYALRAWDSSGTTQDDTIRQTLNIALDRLAGEVPEALVPDEEHVVLMPDILSTDSAVSALAKMAGTVDISASATARTDRYDTRILEFFDLSSVPIAASSSATSWRPHVSGEFDGVMHIELTDRSTGAIQRRQCVEFFTINVTYGTGDSAATVLRYRVTLDRPLSRPIEDASVADSPISAYDFRIYQPEFFVRDDVMEVLEPSVVFDDTRQQVWKIDTAGARRQDMLDFKGNSLGRPYRCWRGRHFQLQAPTEAPKVQVALSERKDKIPVVQTLGEWSQNSHNLPRGKFAIRYTYVWGRKEFEWQKAPGVTPGSYEDLNTFGGTSFEDGNDDVVWSYAVASDLVSTSPPADNLRFSGIPDPQFESAPSPITIVDNRYDVDKFHGGAIVLSATNIDAMLGFGDSKYNRFKQSGLRIRYYVAQLETEYETEEHLGFNLRNVETNHRFYLLCEVEPTYNVFKDDTRTSVLTTFFGSTAGYNLLVNTEGGAQILWNGSQLYDYQRPLRHSTGYYGWKVFPHQDQRYELDLRVLRLPEKFIDDQDTAPIQRDAVSALIELTLYYISLNDGNDQTSAQAHLNRYQDLVKLFRERYANTGGIVEAVPFTGYRMRNRYGTFGSTTLDD